MSHGKYSKRGFLYNDLWSHRTKQLTNKCRICGCEGYSPIILEKDFLNPSSKIYSENRHVYSNLMKIFKKSLKLDYLGRCEDCARIQDNIF